ncbi:hypothetical protein MJO28_002343 [Puccinia striiformis f. sp. tritici]|uniref:Uncharacterized protein n=1 Tax=Puccinia striiformis f. sp. tritici TaxID=168172 RepID=A0ACC0EXR0_9BASI|nr:hypothetical protein Pst134EB_003577 [Puccinia striiformis f. sp. tritici]KAI7961854.1 hypothetical protein MJO28_002343 [Puccinia striiformis f. sp. tritici]KAI9609877.1 hypothetical protein H4Q26_006866 [Puccinia striiformis f. sp. tritici PST-130]
MCHYISLNDAGIVRSSTSIVWNNSNSFAEGTPLEALERGYILLRYPLKALYHPHHAHTGSHTRSNGASSRLRTAFLIVRYDVFTSGCDRHGYREIEGSSSLLAFPPSIDAPRRSGGSKERLHLLLPPEWKEGHS